MKILAQATGVCRMDSRQRQILVEFERVKQCLARGQAVLAREQQQTQLDLGHEIALIQPDRNRVRALCFRCHATFQQCGAVVAPIGTALWLQLGQAGVSRKGFGKAALKMQAEGKQLHYLLVIGVIGQLRTTESFRIGWSRCLQGLNDQGGGFSSHDINKKGRVIDSRGPSRLTHSLDAQNLTVTRAQK
nr:hypothetical protein [Dyella sp. S184]